MIYLRMSGVVLVVFSGKAKGELAQNSASGARKGWVSREALVWRGPKWRYLGSAWENALRQAKTSNQGRFPLIPDNRFRWPCWPSAWSSFVRLAFKSVWRG
jgi:hypothetical protein